MMPRLPLFVFGTLRRQERNHHHLDGRYLRVIEATLPDFRRSAPLMIARSPGDFVRGELFFLKPDLYDETLRGCDELEGLAPGEVVGPRYRRMIVRVSTDEGVFEAWAYPSADTPDEA